MEELLRTDIEQTIQKDWVNIDNSTYCTPYYRHLKTDISGEEYLYDGTIRTKKRRSYGREPDVEVYGGVKTVGVERCAEGVHKRRK